MEFISILLCKRAKHNTTPKTKSRNFQISSFLSSISVSCILFLSLIFNFSCQQTCLTTLKLSDTLYYHKPVIGYKIRKMHVKLVKIKAVHLLYLFLKVNLNPYGYVIKWLA